MWIAWKVVYNALRHREEMSIVILIQKPPGSGNARRPRYVINPNCSTPNGRGAIIVRDLRNPPARALLFTFPAPGEKN